MAGAADAVGARVAAIADGIEQHRPEESVLASIAQARSACVAAAAEECSAETRRQLEQAQTVLEAWEQVWPRLGAQREFRQAVAREAGLWSKRLADAPP